MSYLDTHNHQVFWSCDAQVKVSELMQEAVAQNIWGVTFTDHHDYTGVPGNRWELPLDRYLEAMNKIRNVDRAPQLLTGIELGYMPEHAAYLNDLATNYAVDHVILSVHFVDGYDPFDASDQITAKYDDQHGRFVDGIINYIAESAEQVPLANTIGHYDFCSRYVSWPNSKFNYNDAPDAFDRLLRAVVKNDQALEMNTRTIAYLRDRGYSPNDALPDPALLSRYRELGGEKITIASDAHQAGRLGNYAAETIAHVKQFGLTPCFYLNKEAYRAPGVPF